MEVLSNFELFAHALYPQAGKAQWPKRMYVYVVCIFLKMLVNISTVASEKFSKTYLGHLGSESLNHDPCASPALRYSSASKALLLGCGEHPAEHAAWRLMQGLPETEAHRRRTKVPEINGSFHSPFRMALGDQGLFPGAQLGLQIETHTPLPACHGQVGEMLWPGARV